VTAVDDEVMIRAIGKWIRNDQGRHVARSGVVMSGHL
jgi:hypothetical protein